MKRSEMTFAEGFTTGFNKAENARAAGNPQKSFDWIKAAEIIKEEFEKHPDLVAEAGLQGDWAYTGGVIFANGKPTNNHYTYLSSNWATPTLVLEWDGVEQKEIECYTTGNEFDSDSKWDERSIKVIGIELDKED